MASIAKRPDGAYRARYYDPSGKQHAKHFRRKTDAQQWLDRETAELVAGAWVDPKAAKITLGEWCRTWLAGYGTRKPRTVRQAEVHISKITEAFGARRLDSIRPSEVKSWTAALHAEGLADSYIYAIHARLAQVLSDAVHDGVLTRSPVSRRTSPKAGKQRPHVASTEHVWVLHDAMGERYRSGLLLASFAGLRLAEVCGLRVSDVDFMRGIVNPALQYPADPLKTEISRTAVPIPESLALTLGPRRRVLGQRLVADRRGGPPARTLASAARLPRGAGQGGRPAGRLPVPRPAALLRLAADQLGRRRQGGAGPAAARVSQDHLGHIRAPVAGLRRQHAGRRRQGLGGPRHEDSGASWGLSGD
jgi:integrase